METSLCIENRTYHVVSTTNRNYSWWVEDQKLSEVYFLKICKQDTQVSIDQLQHHLFVRADADGYLPFSKEMQDGREFLKPFIKNDTWYEKDMMYHITEGDQPENEIEALYYATLKEKIFDQLTYKYFVLLRDVILLEDLLERKEFKGHMDNLKIKWLITAIEAAENLAQSGSYFIIDVRNILLIQGEYPTHEPQAKIDYSELKVASSLEEQIRHLGKAFQFVIYGSFDARNAFSIFDHIVEKMISPKNSQKYTSLSTIKNDLLRYSALCSNDEDIVLEILANPSKKVLRQDLSQKNVGRNVRYIFKCQNKIQCSDSIFRNFNINF